MSNTSHTPASGAATLALPGRPPALTRTQRTREAVLEVTFDLIKQRGYAGTSIDTIVSTAGISKSTFYSNWRSKSELVVEIVGRFADDASLTPDTGNVREDLLRALRRLVDVANQLQGFAQCIIAEAVHDGELAAALERFVDGWRRHERELVDRSIKRGIVPDDVDQDIATDLVASTVYFRVLLAGPTRGTEDLAERLVDPILRAWGVAAAPPVI